jgi:hypothetical protein
MARNNPERGEWMKRKNKGIRRDMAANRSAKHALAITKPANRENT